MADIVERIRIEGDATNYKRAVSESQSKLKQFYKTAEKGNQQTLKATKQTEQATQSASAAFGNWAKGAAGALVGVTALYKGVVLLADQWKKGLADAVAYRETTERLQIALRGAGLEVGAYTVTLEAEAAALQDLTGDSDEIIRSLQTQAIAMGVSVDKTSELITASYGLSKAMGVDMKTAQMQLIKSQSGLLEETLKMVPALRDLTKEQLENGEAITVVAEQYGKFAGMQGPNKQLTLLTNAWADLREAVANATLETSTFDSIATALTGRLKVATRGVQTFGVEFFGALFQSPKEVQDAARAIEKARLAWAKGMQSDAAATGAAGMDFGAGAGEGPKAPEQFLLTVGGRKKKNGAGQKKDDPFNFGAGEGESPAQTLEQIVDTREAGGIYAETVANMQLQLELEKQVSEGIIEIRTNHYDVMQAQRERDAAHELKLAEETTRQRERQEDQKVALISGAAQLATSIALQAMEDWITGADVSGKKIAQAVLRGVGRQLFGQGQADVLLGISALLKGMPNGLALIKHGGVMMAAGTALIAGSALAGRAAGGGGGGGGGASAGRGDTGMAATNTTVGAGGDASFASATGMMRGKGMRDDGPREITVVFNGPTTKAEVGVAIKDAIREAESRGF